MAESGLGRVGGGSCACSVSSRIASSKEKSADAVCDKPSGQHQHVAGRGFPGRLVFFEPFDRH